MGLWNSQNRTIQPLVLDASVVINLSASGFAEEIIKALPSPVLVTQSVIAELEAGQDRSRHHGQLLNDLIAAGVVTRAHLGEVGLDIFTQLVTGRAAETLDDGEAETVAHAVEVIAMAVIDEKKANRICAARFPELQVACTADLFMHPYVVAALKEERLVQGVVNALRAARMQVPQHHLPWIVELIGIEEAKKCLSLPQSTRT